MNTRPVSAFPKFEKKAWPYRFSATMHVDTIAGGVPTDPKVAAKWLGSKMGTNSDDLLREQVAETMLERGVDVNEAIDVVLDDTHLNGFKRDPEHGLYIEGRQLKAAIKEAAMIAANAGKLPVKGWIGDGVDKTYAKGLKGWLPEHVCVVEDRLHLGVVEPTGVLQRFVHSRFGSSISYEEYVTDAKIDFTVTTDYAFTDEQWAMIWLTGGEQGIGASRSQGCGRYVVTRWEPVE